MKNIKQRITLDLPATECHERFIQDIDDWWPKDYTWFKDPNAEMCIDVDDSGKCIEKDPSGKEITWGRVLENEKGKEIEMLWKIDSEREEIQRPEASSRVRITFSQESDDSTTMEVTHSELEKSGEQAEDYHALLESDDGWLYLLRSFKSHCQRSTPPDGTE
ncbi:MAG: hypothetical protein HKN79_10020 [Flavobacteriales bacterium]|nr:hypothetical protein [Flavobacteriales bacterium]